MMRADIEHLPYAVQEELDHVANILFEEFAEAMRGKQAPHRKAGRIVKLILFGAFADPGWRERDVGDGLTAFDILVIVNHNELADAGNWLFANDRLHRAWQAGILLRPVRLTTCGLARINRALIAGIPFFTAIAEQGTIIYQFCDRPLATARSLPDAERHARATRAFDKWHPRARDFLDGARFFRDAGRVAMAALLLHQACEHLYHCVLWTFTLHGRRTHALHELRDLAEQHDARLRTAWPHASRFERRAFGCIRRAYVEARYGDHYRIAPEELAWGMDRVEILLALVEKACADHLAMIRPPSRALVPVIHQPSRAISIRHVNPLPARRPGRWRARFRWNRLIREGHVRRADTLAPLWPAFLLLGALAFAFFTAGYGVRAWAHRHDVPRSMLADAAPPRPADPSAILDFNIRAATVLEAVVQIANHAGYRLNSTDELWDIHWTGPYRAKATTFDALADVLYGSGLCPAIRNDTISVRSCAKSRPPKVVTVEYQAQPGSTVIMENEP